MSDAVLRGGTAEEIGRYPAVVAPPRAARDLTVRVFVQLQGNDFFSSDAAKVFFAKRASGILLHLLESPSDRMSCLSILCDAFRNR